jgi:hypothetical protein
MNDLEPTRRALAARIESCADRLADAVSELVAVHGVSEAEILARVHEVVRTEHRVNDPETPERAY